MIEITGLWLNKTKDGKQYMSGSIGGAKVLIFANQYKKTDKDPSYKMFFAEKEKKQVAPEPKPEQDADLFL
jgi:hypothetical protein